MAAILMIDSLGKRYGMLPSEALDRASTFDLYVMDASLSFENFHHKKSMNNGQIPTDQYSTEDLLAIFNKNKEGQ
jgi:hypothetical protein